MNHLLPFSKLALCPRTVEQRILKAYGAWCRSQRRRCYSMRSVLDYLRGIKGKTRGTIRRYAVSIRRHITDQTGHDPMTPLDRAEFRTIVDACVNGSCAYFQRDELKLLFDSFHYSWVDTRDKAIILLAYTARLDWTELRNLDCKDVLPGPRGLEVRAGRTIIRLARYSDKRYCVVAAVERLLRSHPVSEGALFLDMGKHPRRLSSAAMGCEFTRRLKRLGLHLPGRGMASLHGAMVVNALQRGASNWRIMVQAHYLHDQSVEDWRRAAEHDVLK